jgi:hypothetical protein
MAAKKDPKTKPAPKTYSGIGGLLGARTRRTLPRGIKAYVVYSAGNAYVEIRKGTDVLANISAETICEDWIKRLGFTFAKA